MSISNVQAAGAGETHAGRSVRARFFDALTHITQIVSSGRSLDSLLQATVELVRSLIDVERCSVLLADPGERALRMKASNGLDPTEWARVRIPIGEGIAGTVAAEGAPMLVADISASRWAAQAIPERYPTSSFMCVPLTAKDRAIGVLCVTNAHDSVRFTGDDLDLISAFASFLALSVENSRLLSSSETMRVHLEKIVESLPVAILTMDLRRRITLSNKRMLHLLGTGREGATDGRMIEEVLPTQMRETLEELTQETLRYGVDARREIELTQAEVGSATITSGPAAHSRELPLEFSTIPLSDAAGKIDGILATFHDLSMRREMDELRRTDEMKSHFMSLISHELRTPLTSIKGAVHLLLNGPTADPPTTGQRKLLEIVNQNSERLSRLVNDLLDMVQLEGGNMAMHQRDEPLAPLIDAVVTGYKPIAEARGLTLKTDLREVSAAVDRPRFMQAVANLIDNSLKFTPRGGEVELILAPREHWATVTVRDNGPGIPQDVIPRLFSKFFQAQNPLTRNISGTGIGLYLTKSIIELHGGRIRASEGLRNGAEFTIELPLISGPLLGK